MGQFELFSAKLEAKHGHFVLVWCKDDGNVGACLMMRAGPFHWFGGKDDAFWDELICERETLNVKHRYALNCFDRVD